MRIEILGNYRIGQEPWRLIEVQLSDVGEPIDFGRFMLPEMGEPESNWQVPWDERVLSQNAQIGEIHACFFLFVVGNEPLKTPAGPVALPAVTDRPARLDFIEFEEP